MMDSIWLGGAEWVTVRRTGLGRNAVMAPISVVALLAMPWRAWSVDHAIGWF